MKIEDVIITVLQIVNFKRVNGKNHRQFQNLHNKRLIYIFCKNSCFTFLSFIILFPVKPKTFTFFVLRKTIKKFCFFVHLQPRDINKLLLTSGMGLIAKFFKKDKEKLLLAESEDI